MDPDALGLIAAAAFLAVVASAPFAGGCTETRRAQGEDCLKDVDCISGICSQLRCAAEPIAIDAQVTAPVFGDAADGPFAGDTAGDVSAEGGSSE